MTPEEKKAVGMIGEACKLLKWDIAASSKEEDCNGLVIGTPEFIERYTEKDTEDEQGKEVH